MKPSRIDMPLPPVLHRRSMAPYSEFNYAFNPLWVRAAARSAGTFAHRATSTADARISAPFQRIAQARDAIAVCLGYSLRSAVRVASLFPELP
jgi:hypothetical protein